MRLRKFTRPEVRMASAVWVSGLILIAFLLSIPPANLPLFPGLAGLAILPLFSGPLTYRVFGALALVVSFLMANFELRTGIENKKQMQLKIGSFSEGKRTQVRSLETHQHLAPHDRHDPPSARKCA